jgi:hypothetical protein
MAKRTARKRKVREASLDRAPIVSAFRGIYFILIGLAIVNSLRPVLIRLLSIRYSSPDFLVRVNEFFTYFFLKDPVALLWLAFLITLIRFTFGGIHSLVVDKRSDNFVRFLFDIHFYIFTIILFFVLGSLVGYPGRFVVAFQVLIFWDLFWILLVQVIMGGDGFNGMLERLDLMSPWIGTDLGLLIVLFIANPAAILIGAVAMAIADYYICRREYW